MSGRLPCRMAVNMISRLSKADTRNICESCDCISQPAQLDRVRILVSFPILSASSFFLVADQEGVPDLAGHSYWPSEPELGVSSAVHP